MSNALHAAETAATTEFDAYLARHQSAAAIHVPDCVVEAAERAYREAGGKGKIRVVGYGNSTHPVCSVGVESKD
jgi:hypothetical protein